VGVAADSSIGGWCLLRGQGWCYFPFWLFDMPLGRKIESVLVDCFYFSAFWAGLAGVGYSLEFTHSTFHEVFLVSLLLLLLGYLVLSI
jgi:hypothetical protein